jgi:hypothetical protein
VALPSALHVLTVATQHECKLWPSQGSSSSGPKLAAAGSDCSSVCCTLLPGFLPGEVGTTVGATHPVLSSDGQFVLLGMGCGSLVCWDVQQAQRTAHLPVNRKRGNPAAVGRWSQQPLTALALAADCTLLVAGDAAGRLLLRCR